MPEDTKKTHLEIWGDIVDIFDLTRAIILSTVITMGAYFLAPADNISLQLFAGLGGALVGFLITAIWIQPKRDIIENEQHMKINQEGDQ